MAIEYRRLESDVESMAIPVGARSSIFLGITGHFHFPAAAAVCSARCNNDLRQSYVIERAGRIILPSPPLHPPTVLRPRRKPFEWSFAYRGDSLPRREVT